MNRKKNEIIFLNVDTLRDLWYNIKCTNMRILGDAQGEEGENVFEDIIDGNFPNLGKETEMEASERV